MYVHTARAAGSRDSVCVITVLLYFKMSSFNQNCDYNFINPLPKHLECPICLLVLKAPHVISCCGHHFCHICIQRILDDAKPCPLCQEKDFKVMLHKGVMREINGLMVKCPFEEAGCSWEGELGNVALHVSTEQAKTRGGVCEYMLVHCVYQCGFRCQRRFIKKHEEEECEARPIEVKLSFCSHKIDRVMKENKHLNREINELKEKIKTVVDENKSLKEQVSKLGQNQLKKSAKPNYMYDIEALKRELNELRLSHTTQLNSSRAEFQSLKKELEKQQKVISDLAKVIPFPIKIAAKPIDPLNVVMVEELKEKNIVKTKRVEDVLKAIDRKYYAPTNHYVDSPQSIGHNTTISAPHMHAHTLELLKDVLVNGAAVLDVGSGSGYLTACMAYMCYPNGYAVGIDCVDELSLQANRNIMKDNAELLRHNVFILSGDGSNGYPPKAPYDVIHVGAATPEVPQALYDQLKCGGRMIIPVVYQGGSQFLEIHEKKMDGTISRKKLMGVRYALLKIW